MICKQSQLNKKFYISASISKLNCKTNYIITKSKNKIVKLQKKYIITKSKNEIVKYTQK